MVTLFYVSLCMKYWTVQDLSAWQEAQRVGVLTGNVEYIYEHFVDPYDWLVKQMKVRLNIDYDFYPVWLWTKRPDLRRRAHVSKGETGVLLEVDIDPATVLISEFEAWHCVLNLYDLQIYEDEVVDKEKSWERIFDFDLLRLSPDWFGELTEQGTTPNISIENIKHIRTFIGR